MPSRSGPTGRPVLRASKSSSQIPTFNVKRSGARQEVKITEVKRSQTRSPAASTSDVPLVLGASSSDNQETVQWPDEDSALPRSASLVPEPAPSVLELEELLDDVEDVFTEVRKHGMVSVPQTLNGCTELSVDHSRDKMRCWRFGPKTGATSTYKHCGKSPYLI